MTEIETVAEIVDDKLTGEWTFSELIILCDGCNGLRDCIHIPFSDSFKLFENYIALDKKVKSVRDTDGVYLDGLKDSLAELYSIEGQSDNVTKKGLEFNAKQRESADKKHEFSLFKIPDTFPRDEKSYNLKRTTIDNNIVTINTLKCYQDLKMFGVIV